MTEPDPLTDMLFGDATGLSAARVPHLVTALDSELVHAVVRVNGAKPGIWNIPAPFDEENRYEPYRENARFSEWALPYNQSELLKGESLHSDTLITDSSVDEAVLEALSRSLPEGAGYQNLPDFPAALKMIGWALIPLGQEAEYALFVSSPAKQDYAALLQSWCHQQGRAFSTLAQQDGRWTLKPYPAPPEIRQRLVAAHGAHFLARLALLGVPPSEVTAAVSELAAKLGRGEKE